MNNYYFTFGYCMKNIHGEPMKDYWVRVVAKNAVDATIEFRKQFSSIEMGHELMYANSYCEENFDKSFFPEGEYTCI